MRPTRIKCSQPHFFCSVVTAWGSLLRNALNLTFHLVVMVRVSLEGNDLDLTFIFSCDGMRLAPREWSPPHFSFQLWWYATTSAGMISTSPLFSVFTVWGLLQRIVSTFIFISFYFSTPYFSFSFVKPERN